MDLRYLLLAICIEGAASVVLLGLVALGLARLNHMLEEMVNVPG